MPTKGNPDKGNTFLSCFLSNFRVDNGLNATSSQLADGRRLSFSIEDLEARMMLSGSGVDADADFVFASTGSVETAAPADRVYSNATSLPVDEASETNQAVITSVTVSVNGEQITLTNNFDTLRLNAGEEIVVESISYSVHESINSEGILTAEAYVSKLGNGESASTPDYSDGRFTPREDVNDVAVGESILGRTSGSWIVEAGTDRLSVALIHYFGTEFARKSTFAIRLQVGTPDFSVDPSVAKQFFEGEVKAGQEFNVFGSWANQGEGHYHNYSEVDIFNATTGEVEWVGVTIGNSNAADPVSGEYLNTNPSDAFATRWTPKFASDYVIKFFVDPEDSWSESNEENNLIEVRISVAPEDPALVANGEGISGQISSDFRKLDVLANDVGEGLKLQSFTQGENGRVRKDSGGTLRYIPNRHFVGTDQFTYTVTDEHGNSETGTVEIKVLDKGLAVPNVEGKVGQQVDLMIDLDTGLYDAVLIRGLPKDGVKLTAGKRLKNGRYIVKAADLDGLKIESKVELKGKRIVLFGMKDGKVARSSRDVTRISLEQASEHSTAKIKELGQQLLTKFASYVNQYSDRGYALQVSRLPSTMQLIGSEQTKAGYLITGENVDNLEIKFAENATWHSILRDSSRIRLKLVKHS